MLFHAAFDYQAPEPRNTTQKSKNKENKNTDNLLPKLLGFVVHF